MSAKAAGAVVTVVPICLFHDPTAPIERGLSTPPHHTQVMNAQAAGAVAAIVYDDVYESLIIMSKPKGHPDPDIPSVFVSEKAGILMRKLMTLDVIRVRLTPVGLLVGWWLVAGRESEMAWVCASQVLAAAGGATSYAAALPLPSLCPLLPLLCSCLRM